MIPNIRIEMMYDTNVAAMAHQNLLHKWNAKPKQPNAMEMAKQMHDKITVEYGEKGNEMIHTGRLFVHRI